MTREEVLTVRCMELEAHMSGYQSEVEQWKRLAWDEKDARIMMECEIESLREEVKKLRARK